MRHEPATTAQEALGPVTAQEGTRPRFALSGINALRLHKRGPTVSTHQFSAGGDIPAADERERFSTASTRTAGNRVRLSPVAHAGDPPVRGHEEAREPGKTVGPGHETAAGGAAGGSGGTGIPREHAASSPDDNTPEAQRARFEIIRRAETPAAALHAILGVETSPRSVAELPRRFILPARISDHLDEVTQQSLADHREKGQLIDWNTRAGDFAGGRIYTGTATFNFNAELPAREYFGGERPMIDFHTHPSGGPIFFSPKDLLAVSSHTSPAHMYMVGHSMGGYALIPTEQHRPRNIVSAWGHMRGLKHAVSRSRIGPWEAVYRLEEEGIGVYEWLSNKFARNSGVGFQLTRSVDRKEPLR